MTVDISQIDFETYKSELKNFLQTQTQFKDYNFEGSNLAVLLDVLSYNTFQNVYYNQMSISEMFLDSAKLKSSVASHAKSLNYMPRSKVSASATVNITLNVTDNSPFVTIPKRTKFYSPASNGKNYYFYTHETQTVIPVDGVYASENIEIFEGSLVEEKYFANLDEDYFYKITNKNVDTNTLRVYVTDSDGVKQEYSLAESLYGINKDSLVYYIQFTDSNYEVYFGKNFFGKQPPQNSIISLEYLVSNGSNANGIKTFSIVDAVNGYQVSSVTTIANSSGGALEESIKNIKFYAPKALQVQERAVTENDYKILLKNKFPEVQSVSVIGGEKVDPPQYGKVLVFVDTVNANGISENTKNKIKQFLDKRTPLGIEALIKSPSFYFIEVTTKVVYNNSNSLKTVGDIRNSVRSAINTFNNENLNTFDAYFAYSKLTSAIDDVDSDIISNQTNVRLFYEKDVVEGSRNDFTVDFGNEMTPIADYAFRSLQSQVPNHPYIPKLESERTDRLPTIASSVFLYNNKRVYIRDNGFGTLQIIQNTTDNDIIIEKNIGSVDYKTGLIKVINFRPQNVLGGFKLFASCKNKDLICPTGSILSIKNANIKITVEVSEGS